MDFVKSFDRFCTLRLHRRRSEADAPAYSGAHRRKSGKRAENIDQVLEVRGLGVTRVGLTSTAVVLDEWKSRLAAGVTI